MNKVKPGPEPGHMSPFIFSCVCGKTENVVGQKLALGDATAMVIARGWVRLPGEKHLASCSPECHNGYEEQRYCDWRDNGGYLRWWEYSPYGRAKYGCDPPPCRCKRWWETIDHPTRGPIKLLDYRHEDGCWWRHCAPTAPHPEGKTVTPKLCHECGELADVYVEARPMVKGSTLNYTRFLFYCGPCRGPYNLRSEPRTASYQQ